MRGFTQRALLEEMAQAWGELEGALGRLAAGQWAGPVDAQGWTVRDHVAHLAAWGQSAVAFLQHRPRHEGLGIDAAIYLGEDFDAMNVVLQRMHQAMPAAEAMAWLRTTHGQLMALVEGLSDAELALPYRHYLPEEPGDGDGPPAYAVIYNNSAGHYREHQAWLAAFVAEA